MSGFPFSENILTQVSALEQNLELLRAFAEKHPLLEPWACTPLGPVVILSSSQAAECREAFGREGWSVEGSHAVKVLDGVRIELTLPRTEPANQELVTI